MLDLSEFESISPYTDAEAAEALSKLAEFPLLAQVSQQFFPEESPEFLKNLLKSIKTIDEFQVLVMSKFVRWVLDHTAKNFSYDGISNIDPSKSSLHCLIIEISFLILPLLSLCSSIMAFH